MFIKLNLNRMAIFAMVIVIIAWSSSVLYAATEAGAVSNVPDFLKENWSVVLLIVSEVAAFLPSKVSGIVQGVFKVLTIFVKKKRS